MAVLAQAVTDLRSWDLDLLTEALAFFADPGLLGGWCDVVGLPVRDVQRRVAPLLEAARARSARVAQQLTLFREEAAHAPR